MLPVIAANIGGSNRVNKPANILFDSGAQISLIRIGTANSLHLRGQDITVNIVKVGGEGVQNEGVQSECNWDK